MTQPRKPSGPGEWRKGDWLVHKCGAVGRILSRKGDAIICDCEEDHIVSRRAYHASFWSFLARPVENDLEGWCRGNVPKDMPVEFKTTDNGIFWRPSIERPATGEGDPCGECAAVGGGHHEDCPTRFLATPDTPRPAEGDGLTVEGWQYRALKAEARLAEAAKVIGLADELVNGGGLVNRGVDRGLVVVEKADKSDPHYRLCGALNQWKARP